MSEEFDGYQFQCDSTDEGRDVSEGEIAYRIEERDGLFLVVGYLASESLRAGEVLERAKSRKAAEKHIREYLSIAALHEADADEEDA